MENAAQKHDALITDQNRRSSHIGRGIRSLRSLRPFRLRRTRKQSFRSCSSSGYSATACPRLSIDGTGDVAVSVGVISNMGSVVFASSPYPKLSVTEQQALLRQMLDACAAWPGVTAAKLEACHAALAPMTAGKPRLSEAQRAAVVAAYQANHSVRQTAAQFGLHRSTVGRLLGKAGVPTRRAPLDDGSVELVRRMYNSGLTVAQVARALAVSKTTLIAFMQARDMPRRKGNSRRQLGFASESH